MPILRPLLSTVLSVSLGMGTVSISTTASASGSAAVSLGSMHLHSVEDPAAILTLDGDDTKAAQALTNALRQAFAKRGLSGSHELSLVELRLTMGCDADEPSCLAQGGRTLGVRRLVYGYLRPGASGYVADMRMIEVEAGVVDREESISLTEADLQPANIDSTAQRIVNTLLPGEDLDALPPRNTSAPAEPEETLPGVEDGPARERNVWVGLEKPTPKWKWAGFGLSLGLALGSAVTLGVLYWRLEGPIKDDLHRAADESLVDGNPHNDVDRFMISQDESICDVARRTPPGAPSRDEHGNPVVHNAEVATVCNIGESTSKATYAAGAGLVLFGVSTLVFTSLLFIHRKKPAAHALRRRGFSLSGGPMPEGGVSVGGRIRF